MMGKLVTYLLCFITLAYFTDVGSGFAKQLYGKIVNSHATLSRVQIFMISINLFTSLVCYYKCVLAGSN